MFDPGRIGFNNPDVSWKELERTLSDRARTGRTSRVPAGANGGDSPAWSYARPTYVPPAGAGAAGQRHALRRAALPLHLQLPRRGQPPRGAGRGGGAPRAGGAGHHRPRRLLRRGALRRGGPGGGHAHRVRRRAVARAHQAAERRARPGGQPPARAGPRPGGLRPAGVHHQRRPAARGREGQADLRRHRLGGGPRRPLAGAHRLPQGHRAPRPSSATARPPRRGSSTRWSPPSGATTWPWSCATTATRSTRTATTPSPSSPCRAGVDVVATTNAHYATPARRPLATAMAAVRARRSLDELDAGCPPAPAPTCARATSRRAASPAGRARWSGPPSSGRACAFDLQLVAPQLPPFPCPDGLSEMAYLRRLTAEGRRSAATAPWGDRAGARAPYRQIEHELALIEQLGFPGYFLVVWDIVDFCRRSNIYCQGRGSAANSAVCYALGITNADAVSLGLLFERFLSPERDGPPDIDIDIESGRREEAIQYVYAKHGRRHAAQVANVITYRAKSSIRDVAKALGYASGQQDAWSKQVDAWGGVAVTAQQQDAGAVHPRRRARAGRGARARAAAPRHPLRRDGDLRPAHRGGVPGGVGAPHRLHLEVEDPARRRADPHGAPVGQGRLRRHRAGEVRPARPRDARGAARLHRPRARGARRRRRRPGHHPAGGRGVRHALPGRLGGRVPGGVPGADGHAARGCGPASSTTSWWRWPSSAPVRSRAARCTPTSGAATAWRRSPTSTRCWSRR